jgi:hypothetical protein
MRGKGITSGRRPIRPDGGYYRESRRRRISGGGRRLRVRPAWLVATIGLVLVVGIVMWLLR